MKIRQSIGIWIPFFVCIGVAVLLPSRFFQFIPEPQYCGPHNYSSEYGKALSICSFGGALSQPKYFNLSTKFILNERPKVGSRRIFATATSPNGMSLDVDFMGTLYLRIGSSTDPLLPMKDGSQLVKASDPFDTGKEMSVEIKYRQSTNEFSLVVAGEQRQLFQNEPGKSAFDVQRIIPDISFIHLGGTSSEGFDGSISDFMMTASAEDDRGNTSELRGNLFIFAFLLFVYSCSNYLGKRKLAEPDSPSK